MRAEGAAYFTGPSSFYNTIDVGLIGLYIALFPCVFGRVSGLPEIAAVTDFLLLVKLAKLSRGHERLSFLYTMIEQVAIGHARNRIVRLDRAQDYRAGSLHSHHRLMGRRTASLFAFACAPRVPDTLSHSLSRALTCRCCTT